METTGRQYPKKFLELDKRWLVIWVFLGMALWLFFRSLGSLAFPLFVSLLLHYSTRPLAVFFSRYFEIGRVYAVMALFMLGFLAWVVLVVIPGGLMQLEYVIHQVPAAAIKLSSQADKLMQSLISHGLDPSILTSQQHWALKVSESLRTAVAFALAQGISGLKAVLSSALSMSMVPIFYYLLGRYSSVMAQSVLNWVPPALLPAASRWAQDIDACLSCYVFGQISVMLTLMFAYSVGLFCLGFPFAILLGCMAGFMVLIPLVGHICSFSIALLVGLSVFSGLDHFMYLLLLYAFLIVVDSLWITPKFLGGVMKFSSVSVLAVIAFGHQWFGVWGVLLAAPVVIIGKYLLQATYDIYQNSQFYLLTRWPGKPPSTHQMDM